MLTGGPASNASDLTAQLPAWAATVMAILFISLTATDRLKKILGRFGEIQEDHVRKARRVATEKDDGDIDELRRIESNLKRMLEEERKANDAYRNLIVELYQYILAAQRDPEHLKKPVPEPVNAEVIVSTEGETNV